MPDTDNSATPLIPASEAEQSYARLKPTLDRADVTGASMRGVSVALAVPRLLLLKPEYEAMEPALAEHFKTPIMDPYRAAVAALPDLIAAIFYADVQAQAARVVYPGASGPLFEQKVAEIKGDRAAGMAALDVLEALRLVSPAEAAHIRSGSGYADLATDCILLGGLAERHWPVLAPLQAAQQDAALRLTPDRITRLKDGGAHLLQLLATRANAHDGAQVDWERDRLALRVLLGQRWDAIRKPARFHLDHTGQTDRVNLYADLSGIRS